MIQKTIDMREKLKNELSDVVKCYLTFLLFPQKNSLYMVEKKFFLQTRGWIEAGDLLIK